MMNGYEYTDMDAILAGSFRAAIYCRLSKDDDLDGESASIANQRDMLEKYCEKQGWEVVAVYQDDGYTGLNMERPDLKRMLKAIERRQINLVITKDLSRLGRNYLQTGTLIEDFFPRHGVRYIAMNDGIDTMRENNDIAPFKNILNEMYSKDISKKVHSSYLLKAQQGQFTGCIAPFRVSERPGGQKPPAGGRGNRPHCPANLPLGAGRTRPELYPAQAGRTEGALPYMVEPGTGLPQCPHQMGKERPGKRAVYVGFFGNQGHPDESRLYRGDRFPEEGLPLQNRHHRRKKAAGLDCGGGTA